MEPPLNPQKEMELETGVPHFGKELVPPEYREWTGNLTGYPLPDGEETGNITLPHPLDAHPKDAGDNNHLTIETYAWASAQ